LQNVLGVNSVDKDYCALQCSGTQYIAHWMHKWHNTNITRSGLILRLCSKMKQLRLAVMKS